ncbi:MAG: LemA family protein [Nibricoccus sp.]
METEIVWPAWIGATLLFALFYWLMLRAGRRIRLLTDTPTSKAKGVFVGQVELSGRAKLIPCVRSFLANAECVWYRYSIEEEWGRWETESYTDKDGKTHTRQVYKSGWKQVADGGEAPSFYVEDETGSVLIQPARAEIQPLTIFSESVNRSQALYFSKGPRFEISDSTGHRRFSEQAIPLDANLFVAGHARERADVVAPEIAFDDTQDMFLISCNGEARVARSYRWQFWIFGGLTLLLLPGAAAIQYHSTNLAPNIAALCGLGCAALLVWLFGWLWMAYNSLVQLRNRAAQAWSLIDVQLKRRSDLIPRLVEVLKGLCDHENSIQKEIASLRSQAIATPPGQPGPDVDSAGQVIVAIAERYPELKTSASFLTLQRELSDTETRIALARDYYNSIATHLNTRLEIIPDRWFAPLAGLRPLTLFTAESFEREVTRVNLASS